MFASESVPGLNKYFQLVPFPDEDFRNFIIKILAGDVIICFLFDRAMKLLFCPKILKASVEGTTMKDVMGFARTVIVIGILMNMFIGNSEQWEEMLAEEARLAEEALNATEEASDSIGTIVADAFKNDAVANAFVPTNPHKHPTFVVTNRQETPPSKTVVQAAPTMVIYWSIKTAFDTLRYAVGQTDEVKGTGVFRSFELKRDQDEGGGGNDEKSKKDTSDATKEEDSK